MTFSDYQHESRQTAIYTSRNVGNHLAYLALGVTGEAGEMADKVKKLLRDQEGAMSTEWKEAFIKECGDVLWYLAQCATELGVDFEHVAETNLQKIKDRKARQQISGEGDSR